VVYLGNAFSIDMLPSKRALVYVQKVSLGRVKFLLKKDFTSLVKDEKICQILSKLLETEIPVSDTRVKLKRGDKLIIVRFSKRITDINIDDMTSLSPRFAVVYIH